MANISAASDRYGGIVPYAVLSLPAARGLRAHCGYGVQSHNNAWFGGVDYVVGPSLTLRADRTETDDHQEAVSSLGFIAPLTQQWILEGWASHPTASGEEDSYVLKLNFVIPLLGDDLR